MKEFIPKSLASVSTYQGHNATENSVDETTSAGKDVYVTPKKKCLALNTGSKVESQHFRNRLDSSENLCTMCNGSGSLDEFQGTKTSDASENLYNRCTGSRTLDQTQVLNTSEAIKVQDKPETIASGLGNPQRIAT